MMIVTIYLNDATTVKGLVVLAPGTTSYTATQDMFIDDIVILGGIVDEAYVDIGITEGGNELVAHEFMSNRKAIFPVKHYCEVERTIYFNSKNFNCSSDAVYFEPINGTGEHL